MFSHLCASSSEYHVHSIYVCTTEFINWIVAPIKISLLTYLYPFQSLLLLATLVTLLPCSRCLRCCCRLCRGRCYFCHWHCGYSLCYCRPFLTAVDVPSVPTVVNISLLMALICFHQFWRPCCWRPLMFQLSLVLLLPLLLLLFFLLSTSLGFLMWLESLLCARIYIQVVFIFKTSWKCSFPKTSVFDKR